MAGLVRKSLESPDETRPFEDGKGQLKLVNLEGGPVGRATFEPGWQWSKHVKPIAGTGSCEAAHLGYFVSGRMKVVMDDGEEMDYGPGDVAVMAPATMHGSSVMNLACSSTGRVSPTTPSDRRNKDRRRSARASASGPDCQQ